MKLKLIAALAAGACFSVNAASIPTDLECKAPNGEITFLHNTGSFPRHLEIQGDVMDLRSASDEGNGTSYVYSKTEGSRGYMVSIYNNGKIILMDGDVSNGFYGCIKVNS